MQNEFKLVTTDSIEWQFLFNIARNDKSHSLWQNYQNIDLKTYEHMIVNLIDGYPSAFHGIYNNGRWPNNVSRICNRAYINPVCQKAGNGLKITASNIKYVLDNYSKWDKDVLFISRGVQYDSPEVSFKKFQKFVKFLERTTGYKFEYDDRLYSCCDIMCKDCYQYCVWYDPKHIRHTLDIPSMVVDDWKLLE